MLGTFFLINAGQGNPLGRLIALVMKLLNLKCGALIPYKLGDIISFIQKWPKSAPYTYGFSISYNMGKSKVGSIPSCT